MLDISALKGKTVLITGATGLIGKAIVSRLVSDCVQTKIIACVRNKEKAERVFCGCLDRIELFVSDVKDMPPRDMGVDYIIHGASVTDSKSFVQRPVDVIDSAVCGTCNVLEFARINRVSGFVYLSTMEVYGSPSSDDKIYETSCTNIDTTSVRSSYPESKRLCESMCAAYMAQYGVPINIVRLTQTFGAGVDYNDGRVFAEFARCVIENRDIILKTKGETKRNYLSVNDAVNAILTVLISGVRGDAYNVANEETYCTVYEMAELVVKKFCNDKIKVRICEDTDISKLGYAPTLKMNLSAEKLKELGWYPVDSLEQMYSDLIAYMRNSKR